MKPFFLTDEVIIERKKDEVFATCEFEFKGHHFFLSHKYESNHKTTMHRFSCQIDDVSHEFGAGRSHAGSGTFVDWPHIEIDFEIYQFRIHWPGRNGFYGIRFGKL